MQINAASLLAAQQQAPAEAKPRTSAFGSFLNVPDAKSKEAAKAAFEPATFVKPEASSASAATAPQPPQAFRPPGSTLDIRV
jgi:hypothetical protein